MKKIAILGASGSIGTQTIDVLGQHRDKFDLVAFSVGFNTEYANKIINEFENVELVCVQNEEDVCKINHHNVVFGEKGLLDVASLKSSDSLVTAVVGFVGLLPTIKAIESGKTICLANKETLVTAGHIIMPLAKEYNVDILPVDSEHSAIFQSLSGQNYNTINKILLTASGGSFRDKTRQELKSVTKEDALNHPNWSMGSKITIDSATMFNKGLEVIEAHYLFDVSFDDIQVLIHPQSIIHSMVEYVDTSVIAQLGTPDMRLPIIYALNYPNRIKTDNFNFIDFLKENRLDFREADFDRFPALELSYTAGRIGNSMPTVLNAANEVAVNLFLEDKISFLDIEKIVEQAMEEHELVANPNLEQILIVDKQVRDEVYRKWCE